MELVNPNTLFANEKNSALVIALSGLNEPSGYPFAIPEEISD